MKNDIMYKLKPGQLVECEWVDPAVHAGWEAARDVKFYRFLCQSVGYVYSAKAEGLILTACYGTEPDKSQCLLLQQFLPWSCITKLWILESR